MTFARESTARHRFHFNEQTLRVKQKLETERRKILLCSSHEIGQEENFTFEKLVTTYTSHDPVFQEKKGISDLEPEDLGLENLRKDTEIGYDVLFAAHRNRWDQIWEKADFVLDGPDFDQLAIRFLLFHIYQMAPQHNERLSIGAKGLSGEGYKGHVFWDTEIFVLPFFIYTFPEIARRLFLYRYHSLEGARAKAKENGFEGARYPWECAGPGKEVTPQWGGVDICTGKPIRIWTGELEQHITCDVVYGIWHYFRVTGDYDFMYNHGLEIMLETSRFWAARLEYNPEKDRYEINNVIGPDEYREQVDNNAFTNHMVKWQLRQTIQFSEWIKINRPDVWKRVTFKIMLTVPELADWEKKLEKIFLNLDTATGFICQYDGFTDKKQIDLSPYRERAGAILQDCGWQEIKLLQVTKQADTVMLLYLPGDDFSQKIKRVNWDYYEPKTLHDSTLSPSVHANVAAEMDEVEKGYKISSVLSE